MSDILAKLQAAHESRKMVKVPVPQYGIDLYFPPLTMADREKISRGVNPNDEHALIVSALIHRAKNKDGTPAFPDSPEMRAELHRMEFSLAVKIAEQSEGDDLTQEVALELGDVSEDALRAGLCSALADHPHLANAISAAPVPELREALRAMAAAGQKREALKNA